MNNSHTGLNRHKATLILCLSTIGFLLCYPFHKSFAGGLISAGFIASMAGGCADWFAVEALFRKPLGVPVKTELISKNREKIFNALSDMVVNELLSPDNIKSKIDRCDFSAVVVKQFESSDKIRLTADKIVPVFAQIINLISPQDAAEIADKLAKNVISDIRLSKILSKVLNITIEKGFDEKIIDLALDISEKIMAFPETGKITEQLVKDAKDIYEGYKLRRMLTNLFVFDLVLEMSDEKLASIIDGKLLSYIKACKEYDSPERENIRRLIREKAAQLETDESVISKIETWKREKLENSPEIKGVITSIFTDYKNNYTAMNVEERTKKAERFVGRLIEKKAKFDGDAAKRRSFNDFVKNVLYKIVDARHGEIEKIVKDNLYKMSGEELSALIEDKAGNDLQMIRINGSVVGGLAGMALYLLTFWIK